MKKTLIIFLFFGLHVICDQEAFAQTIDSAEYFFDADPGIGNGNLMMVAPGDSILDTVSVSTAGLSLGFHKMYFRVKDTNNVWSLHEGGSFYLNDTVLPTVAAFDSASAEYFFSTDAGVGNGTSLQLIPGDSIYDTVSVSTSGLTSGFNWLFVRTKDSSGKWSLYEGINFYLYDSVVSSISPPISFVEYFYDADPGVGNGFTGNAFTPADSILINDTIPTTPLTAGTHNLFFRVMDSLDTWSLYEGGSFTLCNFVPKPDFTSDTVCFNKPTSLTDLSTDLDTATNFTYSWDFDSDGMTDDTTEGNTTYIFSFPGTHTVTLIVNNLNGCIDTIVKTIYVDSLPVVSFILPIDTICKLDTLVLSGGTPSGGTYSGPGVYSGIFYADSVSAGNKTITYSYTDSNSCSAQATDVLFLSNCTGISDFLHTDFKISISPNPFSDFAIFEIKTFNQLLTEVKLDMYDVFGKQIRSYDLIGTSVIIEKNAIPSGVYYYKLFSEGNIIVTGKIIAVD